MKHFIFIPLLFIAIAACSQDTSWKRKRLPVRLEHPMFYKKHDSIANIGQASYDSYITGYISRNFHPTFDTVAYWGVAWIKFRVEANGDVVNIQCDPTTPPVLNTFFIQMMKTTSGQWSLQQPESTYRPGMAIILPIQYVMEYRKRIKTNILPQISVRDLTLFLNAGEQGQLYFLPLVEFQGPVIEGFGRQQ